MYLNCTEGVLGVHSAKNSFLLCVISEAVRGEGAGRSFILLIGSKFDQRLLKTLKDTYIIILFTGNIQLFKKALKKHS